MLGFKNIILWVGKVLDGTNGAQLKDEVLWKIYLDALLFESLEGASIGEILRLVIAI